MNTGKQIKANIAYFIRYYRLMALAVVIALAVVTGSLTIGEAVRATLIKRVGERLGDTETVLFSRNSFFDGRIRLDGKKVLLSNGFISDAGRLTPVMVWGMDDKSVPPGGAKINRTLAEELNLTDSRAEIVLRLPATGMTPSGSLFVTSNYTTNCRLTYAGIVDREHGGNLGLKNEQTVPCNLFMNRDELASLLKVEGKINLLLSDRHLSEADISAVWTPALSGLREHSTGESVEITSDRIFLQKEVVEKVRMNHPDANRIFSYLANSVKHDGKTIPYSFVTAVDRYRGQRPAADELLLSEYASARLQAHLHDTVRLTYYTSSDLKTLREDTLYARVVGIIPLDELQADKTLSADFPGLSDVEKCTDWDSDLPIDLSLVTPEDEKYWEKYRTTPKVILSYQAVGERWSNPYGNATAVRLDESRTPATDGLTPAMFGLQILYPREAGLKAARNGVDFSSLFLSLGIFIIISAFLLMLIPLSEMLCRRREEMTLLTALGFPRKRIVQLLWRETAPVTALAALPGMVVGTGYTRLILILLGTLWKGATHTGDFVLMLRFYGLPVGMIVSTGIALGLLRIAIGRSLNRPGSRPNGKGRSLGRILPFSRTKLVLAGLCANRKRALLSFVTLATGVGIVFSVGLNRRGFTDSRQLRHGTGGYDLWCESSVPVYHNLATPQGRNKLSLQDLPDGTQTLQLFRFGADDASCLNLNKVSQPAVLGVDMDVLRQSEFNILHSIYPDDISVFDALKTAVDSVYPVVIDETVLRWGLMLKPGDTIHYESGTGKNVRLQLAGVLTNSVFQGNVLMDKRLFSELWSEITGSEIILFKLPDTAGEVERTRQLVSQALSEYGVSVSTTMRRLEEFNSVADTYLTIFLTLGGIGLLLGLMSFVIVVRKDLIARQEQIRLCLSLGFTRKNLAALLFRESCIIPLSAIGVGCVVSLLCVVSGLANIGIWIWLTAAGLFLLLILCVIVFIRKSVHTAIAEVSRPEIA